jgi:hypothetical protein
MKKKLVFLFNLINKNLELKIALIFKDNKRYIILKN